MKKFDLKKAILENKATFYSSLNEGYDEFKRVEKGKKKTVAKDKGEEEVYGAGVKKGKEIEKKKMKVSELKTKIKEMILAEYEKDVDYTDETSGYDFLAELEGMLNDEEEFSVTLLVPTIYYNPETGELAETPAAFGADSELEDMGITNYSDGDELSEWVFDNDIEKAKYFEKEYPGLFKVEGAMNEAKDKEVEDEVEDEVDVDIEAPEVIDEPTGGINVTQNADADLTGTEKEVQDNLEAALEAAKKIGDEKLQKQIGNSLTFFTRQHVVKEGNVAEGEEMSIDAAADKVENAVDDKLATTVNALTDEQKEQLRAELTKLGITANTDPETIASKIDESLFEAEGDTKTKIANVLSNIGGGLMKSLLVPIIPVAIGSMGPGVAAGFAITAGTAGILIALAKVLGAEESIEEGKIEDLKETLLLQKRAGIITEAQYKKK